MAVPILLIAGFLGSGKTTLVNHLLADAGGRRIAAVVNDFGAIAIDAELIAGAADGVVSLANGCICCSLEGDLLRTLAAILRRAPRPDAIVIETSGIADPAEIVRTLMDPVIWREAPLETVLCVVDATVVEAGVTGAKASITLEDALLRSQIRTADVIALSKMDLTDAFARDRIRAAVSAIHPRCVMIEVGQGGAIPMELLFPADPATPPAPRAAGPKRPVSDRFETTSWTADEPISLPRLQAAIGRLAGRIVRAKGFFEAVEQPGHRMLLQFSAGRAMLAAAERTPAGTGTARIVFIAEIGVLAVGEIAAIMDACVPSRDQA